jgi:hypothetical protein
MRANNNQGALALYTDFELTTAAQLCLERNRDTPNDKDLADAVVMCSRWNKQRKERGLVAWR